MYIAKNEASLEFCASDDHIHEQSSFLTYCVGGFFFLSLFLLKVRSQTYEIWDGRV